MIALQTGTELVQTAFDQFISNITTALPDLISGLVFLIIAGTFVQLIMFVVKSLLKRTIAGDSPVYRQFIATVIAVFLWFGVALSFLSIVGLTAIAASLGTATGFLALGVSYALSGMIKDAVAGVYLLRDPDFMPGDTVKTSDTEGIVKSIELRKTRLSVDGNTVIRANGDIEQKWTKVDDET
ncbi:MULTISPECIES: mechanosensitive ion channel domain-containing protein [unclassified Haladaptatus]|uniref:mechanosensitive ion channel domain-containing protein n=1 Tax=unclassified Haladaptatus TaxID=2622732 RepID=UPI003621364A